MAYGTTVFHPLLYAFTRQKFQKVLKSKMKKRVVSIIEADPLPNNAVIHNSWIDPKRNKKLRHQMEWPFSILKARVFLYAIREVQKYSAPHSAQEAQLNPNLLDHLHMKLFRAQRNLYISGFSLFLWLIMRRIVTLVNQVAMAAADNAGLQAQLVSTNQAAVRYQADNLQLKQAVQEEEKSMSTKSQQLKKEAEVLARELKTAEDGGYRDI
ncbi:hypothetical protein CRUP_022164 [Coryphaenoides rupestris]|nr:hypothetical protein CRUP_022164 [Coryphaenoides rupestris]